MTDLHYAKIYEDLVKWGQASLSEEIMKVDEITATSYSQVLKLQTGSECFYLKKTPKSFFIEAKILEKLHTYGNANATPKVIAADERNFCFITKSCGDQTLRTLFAGNLNSDLMIKAVAQYKAIQKSTIDHTHSFLNMGIHDWRLNRLPALYNELIDDTTSLKMWEMTDQEIIRLKKFQTFFMSCCEKLAAYNIPNVLNHSDFHDNNMLIDNDSRNIVIIDWPETSIGNPLLSLASCLKATADRYKISPESEAYIHLQNNFFLVGISQKSNFRMLFHRPIYWPRYITPLPSGIL